MKNREIENKTEFKAMMALEKIEWKRMSPEAQKAKARFVMENTDGQFFWYLEAMGENPFAWQKMVMATEHPDSPESLMAEIEESSVDEEFGADDWDEDDDEDY